MISLPLEIGISCPAGERLKILRRASSLATPFPSAFREHSTLREVLHAEQDHRKIVAGFYKSLRTLSTRLWPGAPRSLPVVRTHGQSGSPRRDRGRSTTVLRETVLRETVLRETGIPWTSAGVKRNDGQIRTARAARIARGGEQVNCQERIAGAETSRPATGESRAESACRQSVAVSRRKSLGNRRLATRQGSATSARSPALIENACLADRPDPNLASDEPAQN